ncbi:ATP-binding protein [Saccharothrix syringae]|uniref:histidine kinase n=1 Tax=Saccharothrix syringae TaxID=103733 RepID=A0A5Q0GZM0_SACSY|nr:ATP-binding protein [Saccharothrix syringae]QFZ19408.1 response regulator [Saccharothrix syringae]
MTAGGSAPDWARDVLAAGGEAGRLVRDLDWSATPLGPMAGWPRDLRTAVGLCLSSRFPILLWWGPELVMIYNDAYRPVLGTSKHPAAMGSPGKRVWPEIWPLIGPMLDGVLAGGGATWSEDQLLLLDRNGFLEECYFTFSYSPIGDGTGVAGVFCAVTETTQEVVGTRRLAALGELAAGLVDSTDVDQACARAAAVLARHAEDVRFAEIHLLDGAGPRRVAATGAAPDVADLVAEVAATGRAAARGAVRATPVVEPGSAGACAVLVVGVNERRPFDADYRSFVDLIAGHVGTAVGGARAYAAQRERARALAELDAAKTVFFSNVNHELRTPLTLITGPVQDALADRDHPLPDAQRARLEVAGRNAERLRRLVDGMLDFARIEGGRLRPERVAVDLAAVTRDLVVNFAPAAERAGLAFTADCPDLPRPVHVDRDMWDRVVLNLLSNAVKYTPAGEVRLALRDAGDRVRLTVADTGVGIPADELPRLFERFHRVRGTEGRSHEGSGIGLAMVRELLHLLGGSIEVESAPGRGSVFTALLPYGEGAPAAGHATPAADAVAPYLQEAATWTNTPFEEVDGDLPRLLVAEDNADLRRYLRDLLAGHFSVELSGDGEDALARVRRRPPDLVLADVMMPRLDGFGLLRELRANPGTRHLPVVLLSARAGEEAAAGGFAAGADDYLVKPFSSVDLVARLRANLVRAGERTRDAAWRAAVVRALHDGVFVADAFGTVLEVNDAFERITGWGPADAPYAPPLPWLPDGREPARPTDELEFRRRDGGAVRVEVSTSVVADRCGHRELVVGTVRDVTRDHGARARRATAVELATRFTSLLDPVALLDAATAGFGEVFDGEVVPLGPDIAVPAEAHRAPVPGLLLEAGDRRFWVHFPRPRAVGADERILADVLAANLATALDRARRAARHADTEQQLRQAVRSHQVIGQAVGIMIERHRLTDQVAFDRLVTASQRRNTKLRELARLLVETGEDPELL